MSRGATKRQVHGATTDSDDEINHVAPPPKRGRVSRSGPVVNYAEAKIGDEDDVEWDSDVASHSRPTSKDKGKGRAVPREGSLVPESEPEEVAPRRRVKKGKGRAVGPDEDEAMDDGEEEEGDIEEVQGEDADGDIAHRPRRQRGEDGYCVGSVVRIKLRNFMTYEETEVHPGPRLNMIVGPNGSGKSSLAAAIAIGLGFPANIMGRHPNLQSYVRQGAEHAETQIELKGPVGRRNWVIVRRFKKGSDKSSWKLNGKSATMFEVQALVAKLGVQANNLCSFLPQDKVSDFAKMEPVTVLRETMRSAGDSRLTQWHGELSELGVQVKQVDNSLSTAIEKQGNLERSIAELEPEMLNHERRAELKKQLRIAQADLHIARENRSKEQVNNFQRKVEELARQWKDVGKSARPLKELEREQRRMCDESSLEIRRLQLALETYETNAKKAHKKATEFAEEMQAKKKKLDGIHREKQRHAETIRKLEAQIKDFDRELADGIEPTRDALRTKKAELTAKLPRVRQLERRREDLDGEVGRLEQDAAEWRNRMDQCNTKEKQLSNTDIQRRRQAYQADPSIQYAVEWIERNPTEFEAEVFPPAMISVNVPNKHVAWQVEALTTFGQRKTFICQNRHDYEKLLSLNGKQVNVGGRSIKVALYLASIEVTDATVNPKRPCTQEQLNELGFDSFAIDNVEAPPAVVAFLCANAKLHSSAISQRPAIQIDSDAVVKAGILRWCTKDSVYRAHVAPYGRREAVYTITAPTAARSFNLSVDTEAINQIHNEVAELKRKLNSMEQPLGERKEQVKQANEAVKEAQREYNEAKSAVDELQKMIRAHDHKFTLRASTQDKLNKVRNQPDPQNMRETLLKEMFNSADKARKALHIYTEACEDWVRTQTEKTTQGLREAQVKANLVAIEKAHHLISVKKKAIEVQIGKYNEHLGRWRDINERNVKTVQILLTPRYAMENAKQKRLMGEQPSLNDAKQEVLNVQELLKAAAGVTSDVLASYKHYKTELHTKNKEVAELQRQRAALKAKIDEILQQFNPRLDALVEEASEQFATAFARVNCTGQLEVDRSGDFADWGIKILVAFRDGEALETLKLQRHSGGERSLATVTYLMSLAGMSRTPFTLVDEINQGMDQRAEGTVHNSMVAVTNESESVGQYFLLTPKLLTGLDYHRNMRMLYVMASQHIPAGVTTKESPNWGQLSAGLQRYKEYYGIAA